MERIDRRANLLVFAGALVAWVAVAAVVLTLDPIEIPVAGYLGAALMGLAVALTTIPVFWLVVFGRHRRIAYRGDWPRAIRRGAWTGLVVALVVVLRLQGAFQLPVVLFVVALVAVAETTLSIER
jgi:hypothetical protein